MISMTDCDSSTPLIVQDDVEKYRDYRNDGFTDFEYSDSSSGYDSSDVSDTESVTSEISVESRDSCHSFQDTSGNNPEVMKYQSTHTLCQNFKLILAMPEMCDVTFLVGPREVPVHGVRAIMATRSRQFYNLILSHMNKQPSELLTGSKKDKKNKKKSSPKPPSLCRSLSDRLVIPVKKYDPEAFRGLIHFVHCGSITITEETVAGLYCGAVRFELQDLSVACTDFVDRCLTAGRHSVLLTSTRQYRQHSAVKTLFEKIYAVVDRRFTDAFSEVTI